MSTIGEYRFSHPSISLRWAAATHPGRRRTVNEDSVFASFPVFLVADGMGGHASGDVASALAIEAFRSLKGRTLSDVTSVEGAVERAFEDVRTQATGEPVGGTTLSGAVLVDVDGVAHWFVLNVGDSRTYVYADGELEQVTVDHSVVQELVESGALRRVDARRHPHRNVITRALGAGDSRPADAWLRPAERGQRLLVCSDGLSGEVDDVELAEILGDLASPAAAAALLLRRALDAGAPDNVSVVVVDVDAVALDEAELFDTHAQTIDDTIPREAR
ncbi:protein phosphatase 2C domain-containing protein [Agrococcus sp. SL85]|uniref:PP2C family protein-serine/threonine phosphatase n=1 Tax=Agrococcus sp. SL85 TaxID=2995141 RepID=UPI00226D0D63|nr:protein phosphatase 2C domain-containing protein [Agrococcus sp. SL85]WAC66724.1 protein phosphatase 2C domain-containing protein [Agrococcus sp. SL85]